MKIKYLAQDENDLTNLVSTYKGKLGAQEVLDSLGAHPVLEMISDSSQVTDSMLIENVNAAIESYKFWKNFKKKDFPFSYFLNYVLPYRVGLEEINDWRSYFRIRYSNYLSTFAMRELSTKQIYKIINDELTGTSQYVMIRKPHLNKPAINQTASQIIKTRVPFDCEDYAIRSMYVFRSMGIPTAYEKIPLWGKFNYGHAQEAILFENNKFYPVFAGDTVPFKYQIAKMYRRTFEHVVSPLDQIIESGEKKQDIPEYFNFSNFIDITNERTPVSNIRCKLRSSQFNVLYLCVYNDGQWRPLAWSKLDASTQSVTFLNMGRKILYHLASFKDGRLNLIDGPFLLNTEGATSYLVKTKLPNTSFTFFESDRNEVIKPKATYTLFYWDRIKQNWIAIETKRAISSSLIFNNVPVNILLKLEAENPILSSNVRPFVIEDNQQIWW
ncbi:hypothetical protein [Pedobacter ghigonis]|uniref:hypothetical protein n=1 Tax=Pedobacter ghigonis TaxID=2730403 RepID=UPI00158CC932|nr:hypothetical protein [Pedobacter ghigonis]